MPDDTVSELLERLTTLENRVLEMEDERQIRELISTYGYVADVGSIDDFVDLFTPDGVLDLAMGASYGDYAVTRRWEGSDELRLYLEDPEGLWDKSWWGNVMHAQGNNTKVAIDGDTAEASGYAISVLARDGLQLIGASVNRWLLRRTENGWRVVERKLRPIGDADFAPMMLGEGRTTATDRA